MPLHPFMVGLADSEAAAVQFIAQTEERSQASVLRRLVREALADSTKDDAK